MVISSPVLVQFQSDEIQWYIDTDLIIFLNMSLSGRWIGRSDDKVDTAYGDFCLARIIDLQ